MSRYIQIIFENKFIHFLSLATSLSFIGYYVYAHPWIDTSMMLSRIVFVFVILASFKRLSLPWLLPLSIAFGPVFDRLLDHFESPLMDFIRLAIGNVVNPQFIIIALAALLFLYIATLFLWKRSLRFLFLIVLLTANIGASSLFHYTQVDQFINLENQRMMKQADLIGSNMEKSGFQAIKTICTIHRLDCVYGTSKTPISGINKDFYPMFKQVIESNGPAYRTMRKFASEETDPASANMYQIFMYSSGDKWFYFSDQEIISPYYFNARRNFSILYSSFSMVWMIIAAYILYRHSAFIDRKFTFKKRN